MPRVYSDDMCPRPGPRSMAELLFELMMDGAFNGIFNLMDERERERQDQMDWADWVGV